ncbi:restriction endonuclease [Streptomyces sp. NBC_00015]|uniref:restriction endonuclease n=1 Tax=Streptomyces sp. NBC_00015 TaxID=2903611 RepID=UPI003254C82A
MISLLLSVRHGLGCWPGGRSRFRSTPPRPGSSPPLPQTVPLKPAEGAAAYRERKLHKLRNKLTLAEVDRLLTIQETRWMQDMQDGHADGFGATNVWFPSTPPQAIDWRACEHIAAEHLRALGIADAEVTPARGDAGIDVRSEIAIAQVKHQRTPVGRPALQNLVGAAGPAHRGEIKPLKFFYSTSGYAKPAVEYARVNDVILYVINPATKYVSWPRSTSASSPPSTQHRSQCPGKACHSRAGFTSIKGTPVGCGRGSIGAGVEGDLAPRSPTASS